MEIQSNKIKWACGLIGMKLIDYNDYSQYSSYNEYNYINTYLPGTIGCASISGQTNYSGNYSIILKIDAWAYLPM